jgi:hypothetical protein
VRQRRPSLRATLVPAYVPLCDPPFFVPLSVAMSTRAERNARRHSQPLPQLTTLAPPAPPRQRLSVDARRPAAPSPSPSSLSPYTPTKETKIRPSTSASATQAANEIDLPTLSKDGGTGVRRVDRRWKAGIRGKPRAPPAPPVPPVPPRRASLDVRHEERRRERERRTRSLSTYALTPPPAPWPPSPLIGPEPRTQETQGENNSSSPRARMLTRLRVQAVGLVVHIFAGTGRCVRSIDVTIRVLRAPIPRVITRASFRRLGP